MPQTILRLPAVKARTGLSRSAIYLLVSQGTFPRQIKLGVRSVGWLEEEIERWVLDRVQPEPQRETRAQHVSKVALTPSWLLVDERDQNVTADRYREAISGIF